MNKLWIVEFRKSKYNVEAITQCGAIIQAWKYCRKNGFQNSLKDMMNESYVIKVF